MLRVLLIWLLALALPAQGVMAATMVFCGPNHHERAATAHDAEPAHEPHGAAHGHTNAASAQEGAAPDKAAASDMQKCSVCASCCSGAAIHDTVPKLPVLDPVATDFAALAPAIEPFAADGPDRPPRQLLA